MASAFGSYFGFSNLPSYFALDPNVIEGYKHRVVVLKTPGGYFIPKTDEGRKFIDSVLAANEGAQFSRIANTAIPLITTAVQVSILNPFVLPFSVAGAALFCKLADNNAKNLALRMKVLAQRLDMSRHFMPSIFHMEILKKHPTDTLVIHSISVDSLHQIEEVFMSQELMQRWRALERQNQEDAH